VSKLGLKEKSSLSSAMLSVELIDVTFSDGGTECIPVLFNGSCCVEAFCERYDDDSTSRFALVLVTHPAALNEGDLEDGLRGRPSVRVASELVLSRELSGGSKGSLTDGPDAAFDDGFGNGLDIKFSPTLVALTVTFCAGNFS
jgi:hypothetical protein